jgi:hypothetical protein
MQKLLKQQYHGKEKSIEMYQVLRKHLKMQEMNINLMFKLASTFRLVLSILVEI